MGEISQIMTRPSKIATVIVTEYFVFIHVLGTLRRTCNDDALRNLMIVQSMSSDHCNTCLYISHNSYDASQCHFVQRVCISASCAVHKKKQKHAECNCS